MASNETLPWLTTDERILIERAQGVLGSLEARLFAANALTSLQRSDKVNALGIAGKAHVAVGEVIGFCSSILKKQVMQRIEVLADYAFQNLYDFALGQILVRYNY